MFTTPRRETHVTGKSDVNEDRRVGRFRHDPRSCRTRQSEGMLTMDAAGKAERRRQAWKSPSPLPARASADPPDRHSPALPCRRIAGRQDAAPRPGRSGTTSKVAARAPLLPRCAGCLVNEERVHPCTRRRSPPGSSNVSFPPSNGRPRSPLRKLGRDAPVLPITRGFDVRYSAAATSVASLLAWDETQRGCHARYEKKIESVRERQRKFEKGPEA